MTSLMHSLENISYHVGGQMPGIGSGCELDQTFIWAMDLHTPLHARAEEVATMAMISMDSCAATQPRAPAPNGMYAPLGPMFVIGQRVVMVDLSC